MLRGEHPLTVQRDPVMPQLKSSVEAFIMPTKLIIKSNYERMRDRLLNGLGIFRGV